jgi:hypothetical protein
MISLLCNRFEAKYDSIQPVVDDSNMYECITYRCFPLLTLYITYGLSPISVTDIFRLSCMLLPIYIYVRIHLFFRSYSAFILLSLSVLLFSSLWSCSCR